MLNDQDKPNLQPLIVGTVGLAIGNGIFSPWFVPLLIILRPLAPSFLLSSQVLMFYFTSLILATATLMVAGVPAAIYERIKHKSESDRASLWIWLTATFILCIPALLNAVTNPR